MKEETIFKVNVSGCNPDNVKAEIISGEWTMAQMKFPFLLQGEGMAFGVTQEMVNLLQAGDAIQFMYLTLKKI